MGPRWAQDGPNLAQHGPKGGPSIGDGPRYRQHSLNMSAMLPTLTSGRRPRARVLPGRPSVVTEGFIRWPPLPPSTSYLPLPDSGSRPVHARSTIIPVIYSVFCVWCSKNIVFYRVLWPSPSPGFILATLKTVGFSWFWVFGRGPERKTGHLDGLGANIGPTSAKMWATWVNIRLR